MVPNSPDSPKSGSTKWLNQEVMAGLRVVAPKRPRPSKKVTSTAWNTSDVIWTGVFSGLAFCLNLTIGVLIALWAPVALLFTYIGVFPPGTIFQEVGIISAIVAPTTFAYGFYVGVKLELPSHPAYGSWAGSSAVIAKRSGGFMLILTFNAKRWQRVLAATGANQEAFERALREELQAFTCASVMDKEGILRVFIVRWNAEPSAETIAKIKALPKEDRVANRLRKNYRA